jgi:hypothetical protein
VLKTATQRTPGDKYGGGGIAPLLSTATPQRICVLGLNFGHVELATANRISLLILLGE